MKSLSKIFLLIAGLSLIILSGARFVLGAWHPLLYIFLAFFVVTLVLGIVFDYKLYFQILSVKTAKKGLSLGWSLLLLVVFLTAFSYFGKRFDKTFDLTSERLNSLSEQSQTALKNIDSSLIFYIFYKGDKLQDQIQVVRQDLKFILDLYKQSQSKIKMEFIDVNKKPLKAEEYLSGLADKERESLFVFVNYKNKKIRVLSPFGEEALTSAIIQAQKREFKEILFLTGHGERDLDSEQPGGLKALKQSLENSGFSLKEWSFLQQGAPKSQPALVAIIGPRQNFLELETQWLKEYLTKGGHLFLALDPKEPHNLEGFLKDYGLIYNNDFILSQLSLLYSRDNLFRSFGLLFDPRHPITKKLSPQVPVIFDRASSLKLNPDFLDQFQYSFIVRIDKSISASKMEQTQALVKKMIQPSNWDTFNMALAVSSLKEQKAEEATEQTAEEKNKAFKLLVFGDSDFLSNALFEAGSNKDLALNAFVFLAGEEDLISIRPKRPKGTKIDLKSYQKTFLILFYIIFPLIFLITGLLIGYKKRSS